MLSKYSDLHSKVQTPLSNKPSDVNHTIDTGNSNPIFHKARQLSSTKLDIAQKEFQNLLTAGVVRPSKSPWASPIHMVPKTNKDGEVKYRIVGDYRALNAVTKRDSYPIPHIHSFSSKLANMKYFSKIDLMSAYHQIPMSPEDIQKTAVITPFGLFEYLSMPFGLRNASCTFQRFMDNIFRHIPKVFVYLDDILVFTKTEEEHYAVLEQVFSVLQNSNLRLSLPKCTFLSTSIDFLGHHISSEGIKPSQTKIDAIADFKILKDSKDLRRFLGVLGFYRRLISNFAQKALSKTRFFGSQEL